MRMCVADTIVQCLKKLNLAYPKVDAKEKARFAEMRAMLAD
jgi:hypothetical protein